MLLKFQELISEIAYVVNLLLKKPFSSLKNQTCPRTLKSFTVQALFSKMYLEKGEEEVNRQLLF